MARPTRATNPFQSEPASSRTPGTSRGGAARGFTLIEGLIASVILCIAVLGVSGALTVASTQSSALDVDARSLTIAQQMMEQVVARPFDAPASGGAVGGAGGGSLEGAGEEAGGGGTESAGGGGGGSKDGEGAGEAGGEANEEQTGTRRSIGEFNNTQHYVTAVVGAGHLAESLSFRTDVFVENRATPQGPAISNGDFAMVTVVTTPSAKGAPVVLHRLVSRYTKAGG